jgi:hypothetical protein
MENLLFFAGNHFRAVVARRLRFRIAESRAKAASFTIKFGTAALPAGSQPPDQWVGLFAVSRGVGVLTNWVASMTP